MGPTRRESIPRPPVIVLCPLDFEVSALRPAARRLGWNLVLTGPAEGPAAWLRSHRPAAGTPVVLAGVAAGLREPARAGTAWAASSVHHAGEAWQPTLVLPDAPLARLVCVGTLLHTPADKRQAALAADASLACMESGAFARQAHQLGLRWAVVRGVSDGPDHTLPREVSGWTDSAGRTRLGAVARSVLGRPALLAALVQCGRDGRAAMRAVAQLLATAHNARLP